MIIALCLAVMARRSKSLIGSAAGCWRSSTDQPGVQVYTGNKLSGAFAGHGGVIYRQSAGLALEPQGLPDAPHMRTSRPLLLRPGETYRRNIRYRFTSEG